MLSCCAPSPADFGRGSKDGLNRERLAFVGVMKDARPADCLPSLLDSVFDASTATEAVGDSLRRFAGEESIA